MTNLAPHSAQVAPQDAEPEEPADNNFYRNLTIAFLVGMIFLFGLFTLMLVLLAGAQAS
jgi:hypothetical protein